MKKVIYLSALAIMVIGLPTLAAPNGHIPGHSHKPHVHIGISTGHHIHRPPMHFIGGRPLPPPMYYRPYRPYYSPVYYTPTPYTTYTTYTYYNTYEPDVEVTPVQAQTVIVKENKYDGINTTANVINAAANVATMIRLLTW